MQINKNMKIDFENVNKRIYMNAGQIEVEQVWDSQCARLKNFDRYIIFAEGIIYDLEKKRHKKHKGSGYESVCLTNNDGMEVHMYVHHIIARCFLGECPDGLVINHIDEDIHNNSARNLEYVTPKQNANHGSRNLKISQATTGKSKVKRQYKVRKNGEVIIYDSLAELCRNHPSQSKTTWHYRNNVGQINDREFSAVEDDEVIYISVLVGHEMTQGELKF